MILEFRLMIFKKNVLICRELFSFTVWGSKQVGDEWAQACCKKSLFFARLTFIPAVLFCCIPLWNSFYRATQKAIWGNGLSPDETLLCVHRPLSPLTDPTPHKCSFFFVLDRYIFSGTLPILWVCAQNVFFLCPDSPNLVNYPLHCLFVLPCLLYSIGSFSNKLNCVSFTQFQL